MVKKFVHERRTRHPIASGSRLAVAAILASPMSYSVARMVGTAVVVSAAPCDIDNTTVSVTADVDLNLTSMFDCEGGEFEVAWSGAVDVSGTIHIGNGTTVKIVGDGTPSDTYEAVSDTASSNFNGGNGNSIGQDELDVLKARLSIPHGLTSAVVGVGWSAAPDNYRDFGSIFFVDGGQLFIENMAIRGGSAKSANNAEIISGGGIHALRSNVTATGCEFEDNSAEFRGGGIFGNWSTLNIVDTVFRNCSAGVGEEGKKSVDGAGGAIGVSTMSMLNILY